MRRQDALDLLRMYHEAAAAPGPWENEPLPAELSVLGAESDGGGVVGVYSDDGSGGVLEQEIAKENKEGKGDALVVAAFYDAAEDGEVGYTEQFAQLRVHAAASVSRAASVASAATSARAGRVASAARTTSIARVGSAASAARMRPVLPAAAEDGAGSTKQPVPLQYHSSGGAASADTATAATASNAASAVSVRPVLPALYDAAEDGVGFTEQFAQMRMKAKGRREEELSSIATAVTSSSASSAATAATAATSSTAATGFNAASAVSVRPVLPALYNAAEDGIGFTEQFARMKVKVKGRREEEF
ncbi:unnamed protein product [Closterium sp. Naga37s-1]|nr:unnamed protein product [Closterium sp. Naga37s-1]